MRSEPPPFFSNKKVTAKAIAIALAFSFVGARQVVAGVTAGALVLGPSLVNAFGSLKPISPALCGQTPPKNTPIISSPAKSFSGASRRQKLLRTGLLTVKDPATGTTNLQVTNPHTKVVVTIDGKGNVLTINDPSKTPRAQSPPLNKANQGRAGAGPQARLNEAVSNQIPNFYARPNGEIIPANGYRYISSGAKYLDKLIQTGKIPANADGTYISFEKIDNPHAAPGKLQVPHDAAIRVEFDTKQILDDVAIPKGKWGTASHLEPLTADFPDKGLGGVTQAITRQEIHAKRIIDLRTGRVLYESK